MLDHIGILLVLVVRPISLNDTINAVNCTGDPICGDEFRQVTLREYDQL